MKKTKNNITQINKFEDFSLDVLTLIEQDYIQNDDVLPKTFEEFLESIREIGSSKESLDSDYIYTTYSYSICDDKYTIEVIGSSYRKDGGICDEKLENYCYLIEENKVVTESFFDWNSFIEEIGINISSKDKEKLISRLKTLKVE